MEPLILAIECDPAKPILCVPPSVNELFETPTVFSIGGFGVTRTMLLMVLAAAGRRALIVWVAYGRVRLVPTKFGAAIESRGGLRARRSGHRRSSAPKGRATSPTCSPCSSSS